MVFDGKKLSSYDTHLLEDLKRAQAVSLEPDSTLSSSRGAPRRPRRDRQVGALVMAAFVLLVVIASAVLASRPSSGGGGHTKVLPDPHLSHGAAEQQVLAALSQTTAASNFNVRYRMSETLGSTPTTTVCPKGLDPAYRGSAGATWTVVPGPSVEFKALGGTISVAPGGCFSAGHEAPVTVTGQGTVNVAPKAMVVSASIRTGGEPTGLDVSVRLDGDQVWESGGADYGLAPNGDLMAGTGQPLSGFASLVEGTLGPREGALAMTRMASPNAYLTLEQPSVTGAAAAGNGTVDGVAVTKYAVGIDLDQLVYTPGLSTDEITTIKDALGVLDRQGYVKTVDTISVDPDGFIRQVVSVSSFKDGGTATHDATYSNFGCAGTVRMPGQPAAPTTSITCPAPGAPTTPPVAPTTTGATTSTDAPTTTGAPTTTMPPPATDPIPQASTTTQPATA